MYKNLIARLGRREDEGFTLIELMVVVLIIAILMAIAIPTFLSARGNAQAKGAESNVHNAITDEQTYFTGAGGGSSYGSAAQLTGTNPPASSVDASLNFATDFTAAKAGDNTIVVGPATPTTLVTLGAWGGNNKYYWAQDNNGQVTYAVSSNPTVPTTFYANWAAAEGNVAG